MSLRTTSTVRSFCFPFSSLHLSIAVVELSVNDCKTVVSSSAVLCPASSTGRVGNRGRPRLGSRTNSKTYSWMSGERKFPWIVDTPFGGWAGIISTPRTRPLGFVRVTATLNGIISGLKRVTTACLHRALPETMNPVHIPVDRCQNQDEDNQ